MRAGPECPGGPSGGVRAGQVSSGIGLRGLLGDGVDSRSRMSRRTIAEMLARGSVDRWGKPRNGLPRRGSLGPLGRGGPATIVRRLVSQGNQRIDRPPFDVVTGRPRAPSWAQICFGPTPAPIRNATQVRWLPGVRVPSPAGCVRTSNEEEG